MKRLIAFFIALLPVTMLSPLAASASTACSDGFCTQTFFFTGSTQEFLVPEGVETIRFEVTGGSGSRGGAGGLVTGSLSFLPERLIIEVGQAGTFGSNRAGGYNGGGASGGSRGNEGSGGGASDIRLTTDLQSRLVVAGGGGGGGGGAITAAGASGGGLIADSGSAGQGTSGAGGTQTVGGAAGMNYGYAQQPSAGSFGRGGDGGSGNVAGGGGGGGGWYGGGGGGGDDIATPGAGDGAGAGGGSSYAAATHATNVVHQAGVQWGHGRIYIHYQLPTQVLSFTGEQIAFGQIKYHILFDQSVQDLNPDDLSYNRADCSIWRIALNGNHAEVTLSGCGGDEITLTLREDAVGLENFGPLTAVSATVQVDRAGPSFDWSVSSAATSASGLAVDFVVSDGIVPQVSNFEVEGCELALEPNRALLSSCSEGVHQIKFRALSLNDTWGNQGPASDSVLTLTIDRTAPTAIWSEVLVSGDGPFTYSTQLSFSETVTWSSSAVTFSSDVSCESGSEGNNFWAVCDYAMVGWIFDSSAVSDLAANHGSGLVIVSKSITRPLPPEPTQSEVVAVAAPPALPQPEPAPIQPEPEPEPVATGPVIVIPPTVEPEPVVEPEPIAALEPETDSPEAEATSEQDFLVPSAEVVGGIVSVMVPPKTPRQLAVQLQSNNSSAPEPVSESDQIMALEPEVAIEEETAEPPVQSVAGPEVQFESRSEFPWLLTIAAAIVALIGAGIWRFSGR